MIDRVTKVDRDSVRDLVVCRTCNTWMIRLDHRLPEFIPTFTARHAHRRSS